MRLKTITLILANGGLLALVVWVWQTGEYRVQEPRHLAAHSLALPDLTVLDSHSAPRLDVASIRDNAVFHDRRSFYQPPSPSRVIATPEYDFAGTMGLPQGKRVAFVKSRSDHTNRTLHVGDDVDGWRVEIIEADRVIVVREDQRYELKATNSIPVLGLLRGEPNQRVALSGMHVLRAQGSGNSNVPRQTSSRARTYQPPPP